MKIKVELAPEIYQAAQRLAEADGQSLQELITRLIDRRLRDWHRYPDISKRSSSNDADFQAWRQELL